MKRAQISWAQPFKRLIQKLAEGQGRKPTTPWTSFYNRHTWCTSTPTICYSRSRNAQRSNQNTPQGQLKNKCWLSRGSSRASHTPCGACCLPCSACPPWPPVCRCQMSRTMCATVMLAKGTELILVCKWVNSTLFLFLEVGEYVIGSHLKLSL